MSAPDYHSTSHGGVRNFVIIGVLLALFLVGGVYVARERGEVSSREGQDPLVGTTTQQSPSSDTQTTPQTTSTPQTSPSSGTNNPAPASTPQQIVATGPAEDVALSTIVLAGLAFSTISYYRSRHSVRSSALSL